jgi:hypothetical protein
LSRAGCFVTIFIDRETEEEGEEGGEEEGEEEGSRRTMLSCRSDNFRPSEASE